MSTQHEQDKQDKQDKGLESAEEYINSILEINKRFGMGGRTPKADYERAVRYASDAFSNLSAGRVAKDGQASGHA